MSDLFGTTNQAESAPTTTYDRTGYEPTTADTPSPHHSPSNGPSNSSVQVEELRRHPLAYAALALSVLALLLSIIALSRHAGSDVNRVRVGNNDCVSVAQDTGPAALYCRTGALPGS